MPYLRLSAALALILLASACGTTPGGPSSSGTGQHPVTSSSVTPEPSSLPPSLQPNVMTPDPRAVDLAPVRWSGAEHHGAHLLVHVVTTGAPRCQVLGRVHVEEGPEEVVLTLMVGRLPGVDCSGPQPALAALHSVDVTLAKPLGHRRLVDGAAQA